MQSSIQFRYLVLVMLACFCSVLQAEQSIGKMLLKPGVHVLMRHALAPGTGDPSHFRVEDCSTQRLLNEAGREQARRIGQVLRDKGVRFDYVFSSQWCRCLETAQLMAMGNVQPESMLNSFFADRSTAESQTQALRQKLITLPPQEKALFVTHQVNITALTGIFPRSGEMILVAVSDENQPLEVIGRFLPGT
ncbi:histidine phosphatase family protein [Marinomonas sp. TW1]|uniref:histidine phosphatase family protein n=1 Tax=Marinomonas sp. TW1 TaxID=1561203 RepID=UPI0007B2AE75|nr:histidine phosphatase family protein [Marinomonas sp. TW1]KZN12522.1 phosphohistidine phosphatase [Marinomonas sp. TW1]